MSNKRNTTTTRSLSSDLRDGAENLAVATLTLTIVPLDIPLAITSPSRLIFKILSP